MNGAQNCINTGLASGDPDRKKPYCTQKGLNLGKKWAPAVSSDQPFIPQNRPLVGAKRRKPGFSGQSGFTLIELIVTLAILSVLIAIAGPNLRDFLKRNQITGETNRLVADLNLARSEAIKRGGSIVLCRSSSPTAATPSCSGTNYVYDTGWIIFENKGGTTAYQSASDTLIKVATATPDNIEIRSNGNGNNYLVFNNDGTLNESGAARYGICDEDDDEETGKFIEISLTGRVRTGDAESAGSTRDCTPS